MPSKSYVNFIAPNNIPDEHRDASANLTGDKDILLSGVETE